MTLSVVLVSYNVKHFLVQCIHSIKQAAENISYEIIVIDNKSVDGTQQTIRNFFPEVLLIENKNNIGFGAANNQGFALAKGEYILILNPDTLLEKDTLTSCLEFAKKTKNMGGVGVKMLDGQGLFLPESKRGLPTPWVSFCKIFGLSAIFPKSKIFNQYHLGFLDENKIHEIPVLSGAFIFLRKDVLMQVGGFDEIFFMYGEDIDLSYRLTQAGYQNYYLPSTRIIHYKGESTKRGSLNYVKMFYQAMILFANKHYTGKGSIAYKLSILAAIYLRAGVAFVKRFIEKILPYTIEAIFLFVGLLCISYFYSKYVKLNLYPTFIYFVNLPLYISCWVLSLFFNGAYDRPYRMKSILFGVGVGTLFISSLYAFMDESLRFSRAIILIGTLWAFIETIAWRALWQKIKTKKWWGVASQSNVWIAVASEAEAKRIKNIVQEKHNHYQYIGFVDPSSKTKDSDALGNVKNIVELIKSFSITEIIFSAKDLTPQEIINLMVQFGASIQYKIAQADSDIIVGSHSKYDAGEWYSLDLNMLIDSASNRRKKRVFDILVCILFIILFPLIMLLCRKQSNKIYKHWWLVFKGVYTWIGYKNDNNDLPLIAQSVYSHKNTTSNNLVISDKDYAKNYHVGLDIVSLWKQIWL